MKVFLKEINEFGTDLEFDQQEGWVAETVASVDEHLEDEPARLDAGQVRPIRVSFNLRQVDEVVVISGTVRTQLQLICSRCANSFDLPTKPGFSALFCKDPDMAGIAHLVPTGEGRDAPLKRVGQNKGYARHAHDEQEGLLSSGKDLDITYISEDFIDLASVLTEQLTLQVPFQPLCAEDCKGICANCGADQNVGRCACAKITKSNPFAVLKEFKLPTAKQN